MKKNLVLIVLTLILILAGVLGIFIFKYVSGDKVADKGIQRNYGVSNVETNVLVKNGDVTTEDFDASKVVPSKSKLIENLTKAGYTIKQYTTVYDTGISAERIYASKNESSIDICYGLSRTNAQEAFKCFEKKYPEFYLLAMNCNYVYFISDKQTFKNAGFTSLANVGTQYICD